jgi:hypothetical protein
MWATLWATIPNARKWVCEISSTEALLMVKQIITLTQAAIDRHKYVTEL